jgi:hypothetical protein
VLRPPRVPPKKGGPATPAGDAERPAPFLPFRLGLPDRAPAWYAPYLSSLARHGGPELAAADAEVHSSTARAALGADPAFAAEYDAAIGYYQDLLEWELAELGRGRLKGNVLSYFGRLKKERPHAWNDRLQVASVNLNVEAVPAPADARGFLLGLLRTCEVETRQQLLRSPVGVDLLQDPEYRAALLQESPGDASGPEAER